LRKRDTSVPISHRMVWAVIADARHVGKGAAEASQHDGRTHDAASSESPTMAGMAGKASQVESGGLARVLQGTHRGKVDPLRRHRP